MSPCPSRWTFLHSQSLLDASPWFTIHRHRCRQDSTAKEGDFYGIEGPNVIKIVAQTSDGRLVLVRQFRFGSRQFSLESPGGVLEENEKPERGAERELLEETGYGGSDFRIIGRLRPNPGLQNNFCHVVLVKNCEQVAEPCPDPFEDIGVQLATRTEVWEKIRSGEIDHTLSVSALFLCQNHLDA
jgi:8-oxo-dGTP pyrophosphatase MutT (NUDIX family)